MSRAPQPASGGDAIEKASGPFQRLFIAVDLNDDARQIIAALQKRIAAAMAGSKSTIKWVKPEQAHLTLVFLGNVDAARASAVSDSVGHGVDAAPFEMVLAGLGVFPPYGAPRVLWIGVTDGGAELIALQREMEARVSPLGISLETRAFRPHLTIARWRESRPADRDRALGAADRGTIARVHVGSATLYQSKLSPAGPAYTALAHANLTRAS